MEKTWKLSSFTTLVRTENDDLLLHNSFMGAVARIPANKVESISEYLNIGVKEADMEDPAIRELCEQGFLVPSDLEERDVIGGILDKERSDQLGLMILPHENCNFRCIYCYEKFERGKMGKDVISGLKAYVDQNIENFSGLGISWFGGEPLLAYDVIDELSESFIRSCESRGRAYHSGISTNGYLLTPAMVDLLFKHRVRSFQICIDGPEAIHNRKRKMVGGKGTYRKIIDNLMNMRDRKEDFFVSLRTNFDNESLPHIENWLLCEIAPLFSHDPRFSLYFEPITKRGGPNDSALNVCSFQDTFSQMAKFFEKSLKHGFSDLNVKRFLSPHGVVCYAGKESAFIVGSDGALYKCSLDFDDPRNAVGKLTADGQFHLDRSKLSLWTTLDGRDTSDCDVCSIYPCCQGRKCPLVTIKQNKPPCPVSSRDV